MKNTHGARKPPGPIVIVKSFNICTVHAVAWSEENYAACFTVVSFFQSLEICQINFSDKKINIL